MAFGGVNIFVWSFAAPKKRKTWGGERGGRHLP